MRRIYITLVVLLVGMIGMAYLYFSNLNTETNANDLSLNTIASNTSIVFSFENDKSFYEILSGQNLFQNILGETKAKQFKSLSANLASQKEISNALAGQKVYVGFISGIDNKIDYLISTQLKPASDPLKILNALNSKIKISTVGNNYQIFFADSTNCFVGIKGRLVLISNSAQTLKNSLKQQHLLDKDFVNYIKSNSKTNKNTLANLYINFFKTPQFLKNILNSNLVGELSLFKNQKSYAALSYNFSSEKLLFNGNTVVNDIDNYYKIFDKFSEQKISINKILPEKTANFTTYTIPNYKIFLEELKKISTKRKELEKLKKNISSINRNYRIELQEIFTKYFKNELITFQLNSGEKFGAIALNNGEKVNQLLLDLSTDYATDIRVFKEQDIPYSFFGDPFKKFERPFFTIIDNYLVLANNASSIEVFLNSYKNNHLLINDEDYINFSNQLPSYSTICFYVNNKNSNDIFGRNLKTPFYKQYQAQTGFKNFDAFCYQLSGDNGKFLTNLLLYKKQQKIITPDTLKTNQ